MSNPTNPLNEVSGAYKRLSHLGEIEDPENAGKYVESDAVIASTTLVYMIPRVFPADIKYCETAELEKLTKRTDEGGRAMRLEDALELVESKYDKIMVALDDWIGRKESEGRPEALLELIRVTRDKQAKIIDAALSIKISEIESAKEHYVRSCKFSSPVKSFSIHWFRIRPVVGILKEDDADLKDEKGNDYKAVEVFLVTEKPANLTTGSLVKVKAKVVAEPTQQRVCLFAYEVEKESNNFDLAKIKQLKSKLDTFPAVALRVDWILRSYELDTKIRGRRNFILNDALTFCSPLQIKLDRKKERGYVLTSKNGDSTICKSETSINWIRIFKAGVYTTGESASIVGLTATALQGKNNEWMVDAGFLCLQDQKLLVIDAVHKLSKEALGQLAESERNGKVLLAKAAKAELLARTRQIKISNPMNNFLKETMTMTEFTHPIQALQTVYDKTEIARQDLAVCGSIKDVSIEEINQKIDGSPDIEFFLLSELLRLVWSNKLKVIFDPEAELEIRKTAKDLYHEFHCDDIPLVSADIHKKLGRLSAALATLVMSIDESLQTINVTKEHVRYVSDFMTKEYRKDGLAKMAEASREISVSQDEAIVAFNDIAYTLFDYEGEDYKYRAIMTCYQILTFLSCNKKFTRDTLQKSAELTERKELRQTLQCLQDSSLIRYNGQGFETTNRFSEMIHAFEPKEWLALQERIMSHERTPDPEDEPYDFEPPI